MLKKWPQLFFLNPSAFVWSAALTLHVRANTQSEHVATINNRHLSTSEHVAGLQKLVSPPHLWHTWLKSLQHYIHVRKLTKRFAKPTECIKKSKVRALESVMSQLHVRVFVSFNTSRNTDISVKISFKVRAMEMKGELGERLDQKTFQLQRVSSQNTEYSAFLHLQF